MTRIVCLSDTHCKHRQIAVPDGDILIHAGDFTIAGEEAEIADFNAWLGTLPHRHKVVIAGNHERLLENVPETAVGLLTNCVYLLDREVSVCGLRIWGAPWTPPFFDWAFMLGREEIQRKWLLIPKGIDILVTHGPPRGVGDFVPLFPKSHKNHRDGSRVGCPSLREAIERVKPRLHVCGHIHCDRGERWLWDTKCVNAANCDEAYNPVHPPIVVDL